MLQLPRQPQLPQRDDACDAADRGRCRRRAAARARQPLMPVRSLQYLALGDSYTIGESVADHQRWPAQLVARLRRQGVAIDAPRIVATTGWTTDELAAGIEQALLTPAYDLVTLLIGVNDEYRGRSAGSYRPAFAALLKRAIALADAAPRRVLVVSIPDWGTTPFGRTDARGAGLITDEVDVYNAIARDETRRMGAYWIDITPLSRQHVELVAPDGLHPVGAQYTLWVDAIFPVALQSLRRRAPDPGAPGGR